MFKFNPRNKIALIKPISKIKGIITVDGDKSISHRAVMLASIAEGSSKIKNCLFSGDVKSTIKCFKSLGININGDSKMLTVHGKGRFGLHKPAKTLDAENSGTTIRLLSGILAGQSFNTSISGDRSLSKRPMARVVKPLTAMGGSITGAAKNDKIFPPLQINGTYPLKPIQWESKIASAQVKSAILLAGLYASGPVYVKEPFLSRDHTERMMRAFGIPIIRKGLTVKLKKAVDFKGRSFNIPGDISSASFYIALCALLKGSTLKIKDVGLNETRIGFLKLLKKMGANLRYKADRIENFEAVGYVEIKSSELTAVNINASDIPGLVDEIPLIAVIATQAKGTTVISGAGELRVKESDRLSNISTELSKMGVDIKEKPDGLIIKGPVRLKGADNLMGYGDHRIVMSMCIAALCADGVSSIKGYEAVKISCPSFWKTLEELNCSKK